MTPDMWQILVPLLIAHLLTDFFLQTKYMVDDKSVRNHRSVWLSVHAGIGGVTAYLLLSLFTASWEYHYVFWVTAVTHFFIDAWKNSRKDPGRMSIFFLDQAFHLLVIAGLCVWITGPEDAGRVVADGWIRYAGITGLGILFLLRPASVIIGVLLSHWNLLPDESKKTGHYVGILERLLIYLFVLMNQFILVGLLIVAKSIFYFRGKNRERKETAYQLSGTLLSFTMAIITGLVISRVL